MIHFQETSSSAKEFLHELNDPDILRNRKIPARASIELRRQQVERLEGNIHVLIAKREEFNRKMEDYCRNLRSLIESIEKGIAADEALLGNDLGAASRAPRVRCLSCDLETEFPSLQIVFARESSEALSLPTEVYVMDGDSLKKGHFSCPSCGTGSLVIRAG